MFKYYTHVNRKTNLHITHVKYLKAQIPYTMDLRWIDFIKSARRGKLTAGVTRMAGEKKELKHLILMFFCLLFRRRRRGEEGEEVKKFGRRRDDEWNAKRRVGPWVGSLHVACCWYALDFDPSIRPSIHPVLIAFDGWLLMLDWTSVEAIYFILMYRTVLCL